MQQQLTRHNCHILCKIHPVKWSQNQKGGRREQGLGRDMAGAGTGAGEPEASKSREPKSSERAKRAMSQFRYGPRARARGGVTGEMLGEMVRERRNNFEMGEATARNVLAMEHFLIVACALGRLLTKRFFFKSLKIYK